MDRRTMVDKAAVSAQNGECRLSEPPRGFVGSLRWIGPMLMLLGTAIGSGEVLAEPAAAARYGGALFWAVLFFIFTKALWNEAIGRVSIVTGQDFLESCSSAGPWVSWVPWFWYVVNVLKDFFLRGGIAAIAGLICYDTFGRLPFVGGGRYANGGEGSQQVAWTLLNYGAIWVLLVVGGYQLAERVNTALCLLFTGCLMLCALAVLPRAVPELTRGLWPRLPRDEGEWLVLMALSGIVMSGSTTVYYSAWAEERRMGLYAFARRAGRRLTRDEFEPTSKEEAGQMRGWLRVNQLNVGVTYFLGALTCLSTFVLGVAILRPAGITLSDEEKLTTELSRMMTDVAGPWSKAVFYVGTYAAVISTAIGVLDGGSRVYLQPLKRFAPGVLAKLSTPVCHRIIMTLMVAGCWFVYVAVRDVLRLVLWMGAVDAPLVGVLVVTYAYMARWRLPRAYRQNLAITILMTCVGVAYFVFGTYYVCLQL